MQINFELVTPEKLVLKQLADSITLPTAEGEITILPGHVPLVAFLRTGVAVVKHNKEEEYIAVSGGFVEVNVNSRVLILADNADRAQDLDLTKVEEARDRARQALREKRQSDDVSSAFAVAALERELAKVKAIVRKKTRRLP